MTNANPDRCTRCGRVPQPVDKFCAECGSFLRDAFIDHRLLLAMLHESLGQSREAQKELERLVDIEPDHVLANHLLGTYYFHQGMLDRAIDRYEIALRGAPEFVLGFYDLGVALYHRGNMFAAADAFRRCLQINPDYKAAHYRLGLSLFHTGHLDEALEHFQKAMILTPEYLMAHYHMGVIYERRGEIDNAVREFQKSLDEGLGEVSSLYHLTSIRAKNVKVESDRHLERVSE
ncbi:MAG TPA: tetratricopeptide repeat protein [Thermoanaerobaculia bacterium]|nr:tetratricopeptide repeat protein [Thermoanaerobaculia bacterium]